MEARPFFCYLHEMRCRGAGSEAARLIALSRLNLLAASIKDPAQGRQLIPPSAFLYLGEPFLVTGLVQPGDLRHAAPIRGGITGVAEHFFNDIIAMVEQYLSDVEAISE